MDTGYTPKIIIPYNAPKISIPGRYIEVAARTIILAIFGISGVIKALNFDDTILTILSYEIVGIKMAEYLAYGVLGLELALVLWAASGLYKRLFYQVSIIVFVVFTMLIISAWARGLEIDCGCFGYGDIPDNPQLGYVKDIIRDITFALVAAMGLYSLSAPVGRRQYVL